MENLKMDIYDGCPVMPSEFLLDSQIGLMEDLALAAFCVIMSFEELQSVLNIDMDIED